MPSPVPQRDDDEFQPTPVYDRIEDAITRCEVDLLALVSATATE